MACVSTSTSTKFSGICQCCLLSSNILKNMLQSFVLKNKDETYFDMLGACFSIEITGCSLDSQDKLYLICNKCIGKLKTCYLFRIQVEKVQKKLKLNGADIQEHAPVEGGIIHEENIKQEFQGDGDGDGDEKFDADDTYDIHASDDDNILYKDVKKESESEDESYPLINCKEPKHKDNQMSNLIEYKAKKTLKKGRKQLKVKKNKKTVKKISLSEKSDSGIKKKRKRKKDYVPYTVSATDLVCYICNETFLLHKHLLLHMPVHFPNHICDVCGKMFVRKPCLVNHIARMHEAQRYPCTVCNKLLKKDSIPRHMRTHSGDNYIHKCLACPESFISYSSRIVHMRLVHKIFRNIFKCHICPKSFEIKSDLGKHIRNIHTKEKNFLCNVCSAAFATGKRLQAHMAMHTGQKEFQCKVCLKSYARKSTLREHMKIHNAFKKHACSICNKRFTHNCALKNHLKTHAKEINLNSSMNKT